jgi:cytochrome c556
MPSGFLKLLALASLAAALGLAGCGGDGDDEPTTAAPVETVESEPALSKEELISQGDAICAEVNAALGTLGAGETEVSDEVSQAADLYGGMVERLQALGTPDEPEGYEEFSEAADGLAQAASDAELASERGDEEGLAEAQEEVASSLSAFQETASTYGFEDCAAAPSAPEAGVPGGEVGGEEEVAPEEEIAPEEEAAPEEEVAPEEVAPETGGAGGGTGGGGEAPGGDEGGGSSGGIGPG